MNPELKKLADSMPRCKLCGHNCLVHTFRFSHHCIKPQHPSEPVGCQGDNGSCDCPGWSK